MITPSTSRAALLYYASIALLLGTIGARAATSRRIAESLVMPLDTIEADLQGWKMAKQDTLPSYTINALKPTSYLVRTYQKDAAGLGLFVAYYSQQRAGESMHSPKHCLPGAGWEILRMGSARVRSAGGMVDINKYEISNSGQSELMFYWYQSKDRVVAGEYMGKILLAKDAFLTGQTSAAIVRITLPNTTEGSSQGVAISEALIAQVARCFRGGPANGAALSAVMP